MHNQNTRKTFTLLIFLLCLLIIPCLANDSNDSIRKLNDDETQKQYSINAETDNTSQEPAQKKDSQNSSELQSEFKKGFAKKAGELVAAGLGSIIIFIFGCFGINKARFTIYRKRKDIPDITNTSWEATWYHNDGSIYVSNDRIEIKRWTRNNRFKAKGDMVSQEGKRFRYPIEGEIMPDGMVLLIYISENYPTERLIGSVCMQLDRTAGTLTGYWMGPMKVENEETGKSDWKLLPGKVEMKKLDS